MCPFNCFCRRGPRDRIHKGLIIFSTKYVLLHLSLANVNVLTIKQLVWTFSLNSKQILPHLGLQHVNLQLNLALLAKEKHK